MKWWLVWNGKVSKAFNKKFRCRYKPKILPDQFALLHWWRSLQVCPHEAPKWIHSSTSSLHRFCKFVIILICYSVSPDLFRKLNLRCLHTIAIKYSVNFVWFSNHYRFFLYAFFIGLNNKIKVSCSMWMK